MDNIQYYYETQCPSPSDVDQSTVILSESRDIDEAAEFHTRDDETGKMDLIPTPPLTQEAVHGKIAVQITEDFEIFPNQSQKPLVMNQFSIVHTATKEDMVAFQQWTEQSQPTAIEECDKHSSFFQADLADPDVVPIKSHTLVRTNLHPSYTEHHIPSPNVHHLPKPFCPEEFLKVDQLCAYQIIVWHLEETLADHNPPPLRLIINDEGGTGKLKLIEAITNYFAYRGVSHYLVKIVYTRIAASHIQGVTCHLAAMISCNEKTILNKTKAKLQEF